MYLPVIREINYLHRIKNITNEQNKRENIENLYLDCRTKYMYAFLLMYNIHNYALLYRINNIIAGKWKKEILQRNKKYYLHIKIFHSNINIP